jgi:peptidyl-prolyl cis-trans isomerase C
MERGSHLWYLSIRETTLVIHRHPFHFWVRKDVYGFERNIRMRLFFQGINLLIIVAVAISFFTMPALADEAASSGKEIASVNGKAISKSQYELMLSVFKKRAGHKGRQLNDAALTTVKNQILENLINAELLYQQSQKEGIRVEQKVINEQIEKYKERFSDETSKETAYKKALKEMHVSEKEFQTEIQRALAINQLIDTNVRQKITVTDEESKKYYNNNLNLYKQPEQVKISLIWIKVTPDAEASKKNQARKKIEMVQKKVQQGEDFGMLAKAYSEGPSAQREGAWGYLKRRKTTDPIREAAFALNVGEVSGIVETKSGYHLIKVTDKKPAGTTPYKEVQPMIEQRLKKEKEKAEIQSYIENLKKSAKIKRFN